MLIALDTQPLNRRGGKRNMNPYDFRHNPRRSSMTRRMTDRRKIPYPFGSPEWVENIKNHYLAFDGFSL